MLGNGLTNWGPDTSIRGTLVTSHCSPPTWGKLVDTQSWSDEASAMVPFVLPSCE